MLAQKRVVDKWDKVTEWTERQLFPIQFNRVRIIYFYELNTKRKQGVSFMLKLQYKEMTESVVK